MKPTAKVSTVLMQRSCGGLLRSQESPALPASACLPNRTPVKVRLIGFVCHFADTRSSFHGAELLHGDVSTNYTVKYGGSTFSTN